MSRTLSRLVELENTLKSLLTSKFKNNIAFNSDIENKIPGILNVQFIGVNNEILLKKLSPIIAASTGSACSSTKPSYILQAIGLDLKSVRESVRFSMSAYTPLDKLKVFEEL